jgi:calmodulin-lysine N-methyltransferase
MSSAIERWKILRKAILAAGKGSQEDIEQATTARSSVRSFSSFELFTVTDIELKSSVCKQPGAEDIWRRYSYDIRVNTYTAPITDEATVHGGGPVVKRVSALIRLTPKTSLEAMIGFNNTGNVCVWPSEEVLAHYCLENSERFYGKSVCELGGGMTCLAGLMLALTGLPARVMLTDGNTASVDNVRHILEANSEGLSNVEVAGEVLLWDEAFFHTKHAVFDYIICADCLFFVNLHQILCRVIHKLLVPGGTALLFNPARSGTLEQFVRVAERYFVVKKRDKYSELVWEKHCAAATIESYKNDLHYPLLLILEPRTDYVELPLKGISYR